MIRTSFSLDQPWGTIRGDVRRPEGDLPRSAVVVVHGFKGFKDWAFFPWVAERIAGAGHAAVSFNMTGSGIGSDLQRFTELDAFAANTYTRELADLAAVMAAVRGDLLPTTPERVGILGHSRGGADAVIHAAETPPDALVTWNAVARLDRWSEEQRMAWRDGERSFVLNARTGQRMPLDPTLMEDFEAHRERLDPPARAAEVECPWLIVHGAADATVDPEHGRTLQRASRGARLTLVEGAGHTFEARHPFDAVPAPLEEAWAATAEHFRRHLVAG